MLIVGEFINASRKVISDAIEAQYSFPRLYFLPTGFPKIFDRLSKPHIKRMTDERVADGYLFNSGKLLEPVEVIKIEIVPGV